MMGSYMMPKSRKNVTAARESGDRNTRAMRGQVITGGEKRQFYFSSDLRM